MCMNPYKTTSEKTYADYVREDNERVRDYAVDEIRGYPITTLTLHHAAGPDRTNWQDIDIVDEISTIHKNKYAIVDSGGNIIGYKDPRHTHRFRLEPVYCAYHWLMRLYNGAWRITPTMWGIEQNVAGGCWKYIDNRQAIQVCILGDYSTVKPATGYIEELARFFQPLADDLREAGQVLLVRGHREFDATDCPGLIFDDLPRLRKLLNV